MEMVEMALKAVDAMNATTKAIILGLIALWLVSPFLIVLMMRGILKAQKECLEELQAEKHLLVSFVTKHYPENMLPYRWPDQRNREENI